MTIHVPEDQAAIRLDRFLTDRLQGSRATWQRAIRAEQVKLNGKPVRANQMVRAGDLVVVAAVSDAAPLVLTPSPEPFAEARILYQDDALLVVNKPAGVVVHPSRGHSENTLVHYLLPWLSNVDQSGQFRPGIVHRLDKDTSGCLVVARTHEVQQRLSEAIAARQVERWYLALCQGQVTPAEGVIDAPIGRDPKNRLRMAVERRGRAAVTHFFTVATWSRYALLLLKLETGRTHQIRVHLSSLGHPLAGDILYGGEPFAGFAGQALHAWRICFNHPEASDVRICREAPLPGAWRSAWDTLGPSDRLRWPNETEGGPWSNAITGPLQATLVENGIPKPRAPI
jgi:23S rRNA pseudouridine1911/1915/1917 synthase